jgi:hypothetical protein
MERDDVKRIWFGGAGFTLHSRRCFRLDLRRGE